MFKADLPKTPVFTGNPTHLTKMRVLNDIFTWVQAVKDRAHLAHIPTEALSVKWATQWFASEAKLWWASHVNVHGNCTTWSGLQKALIDRFVGQDATALVLKELGSKTLSNFSSFEDWHAWFDSTVQTLRAVEPADERSPDHVLIAMVLQQMQGTLYREGVAVDPTTNAKPKTLARALHLLMAHHRVLDGRSQAHTQKRAADKPTPRDTRPSKQPKLGNSAPRTPGANPGAGGRGKRWDAAGINAVKRELQSYGLCDNCGKGHKGECRLSKDQRPSMDKLAAIAKHAGKRPGAGPSKGN